MPASYFDNWSQQSATPILRGSHIVISNQYDAVFPRTMHFFQENILLKDDHTIRVIDFGLCAKVIFMFAFLEFLRMPIVNI